MNTFNCKDIVITRKTHVCGGNQWEILRTGADIKLKCVKCGHIILMDYNKFIKTIKHQSEKNG